MLSPEVVARIKACAGIYSIGDTAKYFKCSKSTVHDIWTNKRHTKIAAADEPANITSSRIPKDILEEDARLLAGRGMTLNQAAQELNVSPSTMRRGGLQWYFIY